MSSKLKNTSLIRKKYSFNNIQVLSKYELQNKIDKVLLSIKPNEILSDLSFFKEIAQYFNSSYPEKAFLIYKFTLFCSIIIKNKEIQFFEKLFIYYSNIFITSSHKYYSFVIIKIKINNIFKNINRLINVNEFNKRINNLIEEYKNNPYDSIMELDINNFIKDENGISFFFIFLKCLKIPFDKGQLNALADYIVTNSISIIKNIIIDKSKKESYFKKINNIIQFHIKEIGEIVINNNSKKKCTVFLNQFFISIISIYNEIIKLFQFGIYDFYGNDFILDYIQQNLITTIMQFLEKKYFIIDEKIIKKFTELSDDIESYLLNNPKINEKKYFIEYTWIMSQIFSFLYHCEDKKQSIIYGNKIINLYKNKSFISRTVIYIKLTLYEYYLKTQKGIISEFDTNEHLNNISELLIMFGKCEIDCEKTEKYLIKLINYLFKLLTEHIIFIINNRPQQAKNIYYLLISLNPFMLDCKNKSNNKYIIKEVNYFNIYCSITTIINWNNDKDDIKNNVIKNNKNNIFDFLNNSSLSKEEKNIFLNIISIFTVYDDNFPHKIFEILNNLCNFEETIFLEIYFNIIYQLEKIENYNSKVFFDLLDLLYNFLRIKFKLNNNENKEIISNIKNNYFQIYTVYAYNTIKSSYKKILKLEKENNIDSNGLLIKISNSIKILIKFIEIHNKIIEQFYKIVQIDKYNNKTLFYLSYNIIINYFIDLIENSNGLSSKDISFIYQQLYLIATQENIFSSLPIYIQNFIYYILYRLIHNVNTIIKNRDLFLIKGNNNISKTIKTIIYNNIEIIKEERKKIKTNDSLFNLEPLLSFSIIDKQFSNNEFNNNEESYNLLKNNIHLLAKENSLNPYINFKINFILDTNNLIEIIKLYYLTGNPIDKKYLENYFNYYIPILNKEKEFSDNFEFILNIFYILKRIFSIPKTNNQSEKINFDLLIEILNNNEKNLTFKKNIIIRLLIKYIHMSEDKIYHKDKIKNLLICLKGELDKLKKDQILNDSEQKTQKYLTYIELLSLQFFIQVFDKYLSDDNIDELLYEGINLLIKCLELCKAFLNERYILQYIPNEKCRLKAINDFLFEEINQVDLIYLLNMDDHEFIFLQLLDKIYILIDFLFKKMHLFGYGDSIIEIFHKLRNFTILKYNKKYYQNFISYLIKVSRKWKRKEKYDISIDICDLKSDSEYNIFISKLYYNYIYEKYPKFLNNKAIEYENFNIYEFVNNYKLVDDPLLNKCLELNNISQNFNIKEKSTYFKNKMKLLKKENKEEDINELKDLFFKVFHSNNMAAFYLGKFVDYESAKYIIKIISILFENELIKNVIFNGQNIEYIIKTIKLNNCFDKLTKWKYYRSIKYHRKNIRYLIYISSFTQSTEVTLKLINCYISIFHNFKYNLSYKGNENNDNLINKEDNNIDYLERINILDNDNDKIISMENNNEININTIDNKLNLITNLITMFKIRNYFYIYIKIKDKSVYDMIDMEKQKDFEILFNYMRNIAAKEYSEKKIKKSKKNAEYRKALFNLQNLIYKYCPNFINSIKYYYNSHTNFNNYINSKIKKYKLKITSNEIINWLFENNNEEIKSKKIVNLNNTNTRYKLMSIDDYKTKFIYKIFHSSNFKFSFYENDINDLFYYIPSIELSKIPLENLPILYNLAIIRTLNINYIKIDPIKLNLSVTKDIFCLLNPKKDLVDTEKKILPIIQKYKINCINSREPTEKEMNSILTNKLMYIYCGHGDSLKYVKKEYIESHKINFLTFLFGCNSANSRLLTEKDTQPLSTPQLFLKQLCPFFFGFLWPVSSQDLDDFTIELLDILFKNKEPVSLVKIIILLKRKFNLKWFNGSALVIYCNCDIYPNFV